jgi:cytochrome c553
MLLGFASKSSGMLILALYSCAIQFSAQEFSRLTLRYILFMFAMALVLVFALAASAVSSLQNNNAAAPQQDAPAPAGVPGPPPYWAFAINPPEKDSAPTHARAAADAEKAAQAPQHVPGSTATFTLAQIDDLFTPPDWHPAAHPRMPEIVARGRKPDVYACGYCHLPNGLGRPENSSLAGLPAAYIVQQMADFKSGARKSSAPDDLPVALMISHETQATDAEIQAAADYFSQLKPQRWIRVVETATVPKTHVAGWMLVASEPAATEPIGARIIEMAEDLERTELRDDTSGFVAYVPPGSIAKGKSLATTGGDGVNAVTLPCAACHGLRGKNNVPSIAGRSPSYIVRQLWDIQHHTRNGAGAQFMQAAVAKLTLDDMIALAAYTSSLQP